MKKLVSVIMVIVLTFSLALTSFAAGIYGDLTGDKRVNSSDALKILLVSTGQQSLTAEQKIYADVNGNGKINSSDALLILQYNVGLIDAFPVESGGEPDIDHDFFG